MNVLEKILEEIENINYHPEGMGCGIEDCGITDRYEACEYGWDEAIGAVIETINNMDIAKDINVPSNVGWIDRKNLKEEIESLRFTITGMRNGKTMTNLALEEYRKSILRIIDEQPMYMDDGWIPVEERLPEEHNSMFAKSYGTSQWSNAMWKQQSDEVNVTYELEDGTRKVTTSYTLDGIWKLEKKYRILKTKVVAWQPLPERYQPKEIRI